MNIMQRVCFNAVMALLAAPATRDVWDVWVKEVDRKYFKLRLIIMPHNIGEYDAMHLALVLWDKRGTTECAYRKRELSWSTHNSRHDVLAQVHDAALGLIYGLGDSR